MNILVTGGAGYIGSHTVKALLQAGHTVTVFDSFENGHKEGLLSLLDESAIISGNLLSMSDLDTAFTNQPIDAVIHFAAYIEAGESVKNPLKFFHNNTAGTIHLLQAMEKHNVKQLVFSSTAAVYGEPKTTPIPETADTLPTNPYGTSKLLIEQILRDLTHHQGWKATILRYFNACGADPDGMLGENHPQETHLIPLILQVPQGKREAIKIFGTDYPTPDGTAIRDYIHVADLASAHVKAVENLSQSNDNLHIYNVGTGNGYSVKEVIDMCRQVTGHEIPATEEPRRPGDPATLVADAKKIQQELNWNPEHSDLDTIITTAWNWHQKHPNGYKD